MNLFRPSSWTFSGVMNGVNFLRSVRHFCHRFRHSLFGLLTSSLLLAPLYGATQQTPLNIFTESWPPVSFSEDGKPAGMAVELVREILRRVEHPDNIQVVPWARGYSMVTTEPNVVLFSVGRNPEREKLMTMIGPIGIAKTQLFAKRGAGLKISTVEDARSLKVGAYRASVFESTLQRMGFKNIEVNTTPQSNAQKLLAGRIPLWCDGNFAIPDIMKEIGANVNDIEPVLTLESLDLYIALSNGTPEKVLAAWEKALRDMKADGSFKRIFTKWLPSEIPPTEVTRIGVGASKSK